MGYDYEYEESRNTEVPTLRVRVDQAEAGPTEGVSPVQAAEMGHKSVGWSEGKTVVVRAPMCSLRPRALAQTGRRYSDSRTLKERRRAGSAKYVYLMATLDLKLAKIGYTRALYSRWRTLDWEAKERFGIGVRIMAVMRGDRATEAGLLQKYQLAIVSGREWFMPVPEMLDDFREACVPIGGLFRGLCSRHGVYGCTCRNPNGNPYMIETDEQRTARAKKAAAASAKVRAKKAAKKRKA